MDRERHCVKKRVAIHTLGCRANQSDSTYLEGSLLERGYDIVDSPDEADYYIFNTCTVTHEADREVRSLSRRVKRINPKAKVIMTGCYAQTDADTLKQLDSVDHVIGNADKQSIPEFLPVLKGHKVKAILKQKEVPSFGYAWYSKNTRAHVKIQDGCNKFCSFCIIPYARGLNRSVPADKILAELHELHARGFQEAVLTGIHIGTYGEDRHISLEQLLDLIEMERPIPRVRLSSLDPEEITDRLIEQVTQSKIICPHLHIAVQSGDDIVLKGMKRRYQAAHFYDIVRKLTRLKPKIAIGTDIIVGFPGETDEAFENTYTMIEELPISYAHVFPYSPRRGTPAASRNDQIDSPLKRERVQRLQRLIKNKKSFYYQQFKGLSLEMIIEGKRDRKEGLLKGVTQNFIPVHVDGSDELMHHRMPVILERFANSRVYGRIQA
jgi:threonylcarbamoyladenosine tRNA methylthiotransferase MtaB